MDTHKPIPNVLWLVQGQISSTPSPSPLEFKSVHSSLIRCLLQSKVSHVSILISPSLTSPSPNQISLSSRSPITNRYQWLLRETWVIPGTHFFLIPMYHQLLSMLPINAKFPQFWNNEIFLETKVWWRLNWITEKLLNKLSVQYLFFHNTHQIAVRQRGGFCHWGGVTNCHCSACSLAGQHRYSCSSYHIWGTLHNRISNLDSSFCPKISSTQFTYRKLAKI